MLALYRVGQQADALEAFHAARRCSSRRSVELANARRELAGRMLLSDRVTPHTPRRTWAMLALTASRDACWVMRRWGTPTHA
jgi:integrase